MLTFDGKRERELIWLAHEEFMQKLSFSLSPQLLKEIDLVKPLGLNRSDLLHLLRASYCLGGFTDKKIAEIGGTTSEDFVIQILKPSRWFGITYSEYFNYHGKKQNIKFGNKYPDIYKYDFSGYQGFFGNWKRNGDDKFDIVFSKAAFEHIPNLLECLNVCYEILTEGGILYSYFSPIWSAPNGSHGFHPDEINHFGNHSHLMFDFTSLSSYLVHEKNFSKTKACEASERLYRNPNLNRYSYEEFIEIFDSSNFRTKKITPIDKPGTYGLFEQMYSGDKLKTIRKLYPSMKYSCEGFEVIMKK